MSRKFSIHSKPASPRFRPVGKLGIVDWREDCSRCHNCVKRDCVYGFYRDEADSLRTEIGYLDYVYQCKGCLTCVQNCTKNILTRVVNPEYNRLGDSYYKPDILTTTWFQAETGRIPVSGSGYGGPFSGQGFDSMWTDMSEIVRPTRDGIHGREYINTGVDIGRKLPHLPLEGGRLTVEPPPLVETPLPVIFDLIPAPWNRGPVLRAVAETAARTGTLAVVPAELAGSMPGIGPDHLIPLATSPEALEAAVVNAAPMVMVPDGPNVMDMQGKIKRANPGQVVAIRLRASPAAADRAVELARRGAEVIHLEFDLHGRESLAAANGDGKGEGMDASRSPAGEPAARHARDVLRQVHQALVKDGTRDLVTLVAGGGIALAEHMAKAIICGADLVATELPLVIALECRLCGECHAGRSCQIELDEIDPEYAVHRMINLMATWHQQLIEVLGAMGIREVRRLRGETGRAMFFEDLERETFGRFFGKRRQ